MDGKEAEEEWGARHGRRVRLEEKTMRAIKRLWAAWTRNRPAGQRVEGLDLSKSFIQPMSESLDHVIGLRPAHGGDPMGNAVVVAQSVHWRPPDRSPRIQTKTPDSGS